MKQSIGSAFEENTANVAIKTMMKISHNSQIFLSKLVFQTYSGYVASQFKKMQADIRNQGRVKWKHVMHLIRLLLSGIHVLREGFVAVAVVSALGRRGVEIERYDGVPQDERGIATFPNGDKVAWFLDPDGNILSIAQLV